MKGETTMTYNCASAPMPDIIDRLKEHAEWAEANIYEVPITLPDDISEAVKEIERLRTELVKIENMYYRMSRYWLVSNEKTEM